MIKKKDEYIKLYRDLFTLKIFGYEKKTRDISKEIQKHDRHIILSQTAVYRFCIIEKMRFRKYLTFRQVWYLEISAKNRRYQSHPYPFQASLHSCPSCRGSTRDIDLDWLSIVDSNTIETPYPHKLKTNNISNIYSHTVHTIWILWTVMNSMRRNGMIKVNEIVESVKRVIHLEREKRFKLPGSVLTWQWHLSRWVK